MPDTLTTRFAPSPTGLLHLGHAYSAMLNHDHARTRGGAFVLRIEDIDQGRCRPEFEAAIHDDLEWLGLTWDGPVWRQSERFGTYRDAIESLAARGLVYRCFKTRTELSAITSAPHGPSGEQRATAPLPPAEEALLLERGHTFAWRLNVVRAVELLGRDRLEAEIVADNEGVSHLLPIGDIADPVLARKDFPASYHLASVLDDAAQGVSLVWRGIDLEDALPVHRLLQELLGLAPPRYRHHRLILGADHQRLAKRDRSATLQALRAEGTSPACIRQRLGLPPAPWVP